MKKQRQDEELGEKLEQVQNDAPDHKFQNDQQVAPSTGFKTVTGGSKFTLEKKKAPGSQLKQEVASSVVRDASLTGGNSGDGGSFAGARSSGSVGGVAGAANATPNVANKTYHDGFRSGRSSDRPGKKLDRNSTKLNYIPCDQVLTEWDESKPLADAADLDQGFNGTYRNEFGRSQKKCEGVPGALMFERSVDLIAKDVLYFGQGQIVKQYGVVASDALTRIPVADNRGVFQNAPSNNYTAANKGNYLPTDIKFKYNSHGELDYLKFNEIDLTVNNVTDQVANKSSVAMKIAMDRAELWRETMDTKAGDEKADIWSCLPRAVDMPTATISLLEALEADTGNEVCVGYRKTTTAFSYQLNRAHKDGQDDVFPGIYALVGLNTNYVSSDYAKSQLPAAMNGIFPTGSNSYDRTYILNGSAATMIALYDSVAKYNTKADPILQPRGLRMHLQTADNNMDPLYADKMFVNAFDANECFSTIDREYDPNSPVFMTDKCAVIHRIAWDGMGSFIKRSFHGTADYDGDADASDHVLLSADAVAIARATGLNVYLGYATELSGSISASSHKFVASATFEFDSDDDFTVLLAATDPTAASGHAYVKLANSDLPASGALYFNFKGKLTVFESDYLAEKVYPQFGGPARYMYSDLRNHYVVEVAHPLLKGLADYLELSVGAKYRDLSGGREITVTTKHSTQFFSLWSLLLCAATPYTIKARINAFRDLLYYEKNVEYPFNDALVSLGDVKTRAYQNFGYANYDTELEVKRMTPAIALRWVLPETFQQVGFDSTNSEIKVLMPWYTCENEIGATAFNDDASAMCFPSIRSGVRFAALDALYGMTERDVRLCLDKISSFADLDPTIARSGAYKYSALGDGQMVLAIDDDGITATALMSLPRELGWIMDAPYGVLTPNYSGTYNYSTNIVGTTGVRCTYWLADGAVSHDSTAGSPSQNILEATTINVNRAANFKQDWFTILASGTAAPVDHGFALSVNQILTAAGAPAVGNTAFTPYTQPNSTTVIDTGVNQMFTLQKALWTRIQKLPFVISPFDLKVIDNTDSPNNVVIADPYDMMYWFGLGGFRASDFRESVYNREKEIVNQGYLFVTDPWVTASPLFTEGAATSGVASAKGFEL